MSESNTMRARLLDQAPIPGAYRKAYEDALRSLFERRLSGWERVRYLVPTAGGLTAATLLLSLALTEPATTPPVTRGLLFGLAVLGAGWFAIGMRVLRKGSVHLVRDRRTVVRAALLCTALQMAFFAWRCTSDTDALPGLLVSSTLFLLAVGFWIEQSIREARLFAREERLRSRLAELRVEDRE